MSNVAHDMDCVDLAGFSDVCCGDGGGEFRMADSRASNKCAVPRRCRRSCLDVPVDDFLRATWASEYVCSMESWGISRDCDLDSVDMLFGCRAVRSKWDAS